MSATEQQIEITSALADLVNDDAKEVQRDYNEFHKWMLEKGMEPAREIPLKESTAGNYIDRLDQAHRLIIEYFNPENPKRIGEDHADDFIFHLDRDEIRKRSGERYSESAKRKFSNAIQKYFEWRHDEGHRRAPWRPQIVFSQNNHTSAYRFTYRELGRLLESAKTYGSIPSYYDVSEQERERINGLVAQRLGIPKEEVSRKDWIHADQSRKVYSLTTVGYDAGLSPVEIAAAEVNWYDPQGQVLRIPTDKACKQREKERVALADETADGLSQWIQERRHLEKYDGTNKLWLNRESNPYRSGTLCNLLRKLCEEADIPTENRAIRWYSLRQTMGRNVTEDGALSEANDQLRQENLETTKQFYDKTPIEKLQLRVNSTHEKAARAADDPDYNPFAEGETEETTIEAKEVAPDTSDSIDEVVTTTGENQMHIDAVIPNTTEDRVDVTRQILSADD